MQFMSINIALASVAHISRDDCKAEDTLWKKWKEM